MNQGCDSITALLHKAHWWPNGIDAALWPAVPNNYARNALLTKFVPTKKQRRRHIPDCFKQSPVSKLSSTKVEPNLDHFDPFGSPVYILENRPIKHTTNGGLTKPGLELFIATHPAMHPMYHLCSTLTSLVSPPFHCIYNNKFNMYKRDTKSLFLFGNS